MRVRLDVEIHVVDAPQDGASGEQRVLVQRGKHVGIVRLLAGIGLAPGGASRRGLWCHHGTNLGGQ
ncbi:hypothetical protein GCM10022419_079900 [Nonomuraea rosea]|uniref:Uncharacterized protein n=1 Tax=Nonomuraea rosea TaxID=638574 RepID=A0ABP6YQX2_9ACTN